MPSILAALLGVYAAASPMFHPSVYYQPDRRRDLYQVSDPRLLDIAQSVVALVDAPDVSVKDGVASLKSDSYGKANGLCRSERFYDQPSAGVCSGTLVAPDLVLTAGHCVTSQRACRKTKFVFGYAVDALGADPASRPAGDVYGCGELLGREDHFYGADWALVRLDRAVTGHRPAPLHFEPPPLGAPLVLAGFPSGLPLKVSAGARVTGTGRPAYFEARLDASGGSSGSGVFLQDTGELVGVMVRGPERDFARRGSCRVAKVCRSRSCAAQDVTRLSEILLPSSLRPGLADGVAARLRTLGESPVWPQ